MEYNYKIISLVFSLEENKNPIQMISAIETHYRRNHCVVALRSFCGNLFALTLRGEDIVHRVMKENHLYIGRTKCPYKQTETNITAIKVPIPQRVLIGEDVNRMLRAYCNIMAWEVDEQRKYDNRAYYAIVEMRREVPTRLKSKCGFIDVHEIVAV